MPMVITVLTLFPRMFEGPFAESIVKRAVEKDLVRLEVRDIRDYAADKHRIVDDYAFGGGPGMVMKPGPIFGAVDAVRRDAPDRPWHVVLLTPQGKPFDQNDAIELAARDRIILICGHYEGVDERVYSHLADQEISLGDFVLTGGEPAAVAVVDATVRLLPGVLGAPDSGETDTFATGLLQYPQYTRPRAFHGWAVPDILTSGDHGGIARWRRLQSIKRTLDRRPDLLDGTDVTPEEIEQARRLN